MGIDKAAIARSLYHGLIGEATVGTLIQATDIDTLKIIPSRVELIGFEVEMMDDPRREHILRNFLGGLNGSFDYVILDCPPSLSLLTVNALSAADFVLIPLQCEFYALEGVGQLLNTVQRIKQGLNPKLEIAGILLTMFDKRTNLSAQVAEDATRYFKDLVFKTMVPRNVRLGEAPSFGKPILLYDATSSGALSYFDLAREILSGRAAAIG